MATIGGETLAKDVQKNKEQQIETTKLQIQKIEADKLANEEKKKLDEFKSDQDKKDNLLREEEKKKQELAKAEADKKAEEDRVFQESVKRDADKKANPPQLPEWKVLKKDAIEFKGNNYKFKGKIIQYQSESGITVIRASTEDAPRNNYSVTDYIVYMLAPTKIDAFEGDTKTFYVTSTGDYTYETITGAKITLPSFIIYDVK